MMMMMMMMLKMISSGCVMQVAPFDLLSSLEPLDVTARQPQPSPGETQMLRAEGQGQESSGAAKILAMANSTAL